MTSHSSYTSPQRTVSGFKGRNPVEIEEERITFPLIPDQIHKVPDSIRRAIKVGKFRKNLSYGSKSGSPQQNSQDQAQFREKVGMNLHVRKIFNFMPSHIPNDPYPNAPEENEEDIKNQPHSASPLKADPATRYFRSDAFKIRSSTNGGMLYVKKKLSPLKKGLTVEPRSIVSRDKKNIKVTFLNIEKVQLAKMYDNLDEADKRAKKLDKNVFSMTTSMGTTAGKGEYMVENFLESTSFSKNLALRRSFQSTDNPGFKIKIKPFTAPFQRYGYRDFIWKAALSYNVFHESIESWEKKVKVFIGKGNNSSLVKSIIKRRRSWMTFTDRYEDATIVWTQIKINDIFRYQKDQKSINFCQNEHCPFPSFQIPSQQTKLQQEKESDQQQVLIKKPLTHNQINNLKILSPHDLAHWEDYFTRTRKAEDTLDQTMKRRNKNFFSHNKVSCKQMTKIDYRSEPKQFRIHNHLPNNYIIGNKKALFYTMSRYYQGIGEQVFQYLPLTFHIQNGLEDAQYLKFLNHYYTRAKRIRAREKGIKLPIAQINNSEAKLQEDEDEPGSPSRKSVRNMWIVKPGEFTNRGNGITVCMNLDEIKTILKRKQRHDNGNLKTYIIQSYIQKPFLYQRRKFDIRHYMMITSINGILKGYWYQHGYIRTTSFQYNTNNSFSNVHLTNDAVQKFLPEYGKYEKGNKVSYDDFQKYLERQYACRYNFFDEIYPKMKKIATDAIKACSLLIDPEKKGHNFQIFGMDFMIDADFHPWLIEINNNPCLEISCSFMKDIIPPMVENAFKICVDSLIPPPAKFMEKNPKFNDNCLQHNHFELVYDSVHEQQRMKQLFGAKQSLELDYKELEKDQDDVFDDDGVQIDEY